jgi:NADP-dependent 3-hydroxy acid dehydrogenase YdfG
MYPTFPVAFALSRPRTVSLNEILVRPTAQAL